MPQEYRCSTCQLTFQIGVYHGQFGVHGLYVCSECGTPYASDDSEGATHLRGRSRPVFLTDKGHEVAVLGPLSPTVIKGLEEGVFESEFSPDVIELLIGEQQHWTDLGPIPSRKARQKLHCGFCGAIGTMFSGWRQRDPPCPNCGEQLGKPYREWMT